MIAMLTGKVAEKRDQVIVLDVKGVGYEIFCSPSTIERLVGNGEFKLHVHAQYRADGVSLYGFLYPQEKNLFLSLIKVDSVGPKSALNIMSGAPWTELVQLIEDGDVKSLSSLPKVSKKTAEHLVVKLKGKLSDLLFVEDEVAGVVLNAQIKKSGESRKLRQEAQTALTHLGYRPQDVEKILGDLAETVWTTDLQNVIRLALAQFSGG